jgi:hypothetical protein
MRSEINRGRELRGEMAGQIAIYIKPPQASRLAIPDGVDLDVGKDLPALALLNMRQRHESRWQQGSFGDGVGCQLRQRLPRITPCGSLTRTPS